MGVPGTLGVHRVVLRVISEQFRELLAHLLPLAAGAYVPLGVVREELRAAFGTEHGHAGSLRRYVRSRARATWRYFSCEYSGRSSNGPAGSSGWWAFCHRA